MPTAPLGWISAWFAQFREALRKNLSRNKDTPLSVKHISYGTIYKIRKDLHVKLHLTNSMNCATYAGPTFVQHSTITIQNSERLDRRK